MSNNLSLVILISGNGSNLQAIIDEVENNDLPVSIKAVISNQPDAYGLTRAKNHNLPAITIDHKDFLDRESFDKKLKQEIGRHKPDYIILAGFMRILSDDFVSHFHQKIINIHPSLLPKYPGLNTHKKVLAANDKQHGSTIHIVTEKLDSGPIILQSVIPVMPDDSPESLKQKVQAKEYLIYPLAIKWLAEGRITFENNNVFLNGELLPECGVQMNYV